MLTRQNLFHALAWVILVLFAIHIVAVGYDLYWRVLWLDHVTHFLGGVFIALLLLWLCFFSSYLKYSLPSRFKLFLLLVGGTLLVGIAWEIFEYSVGLTWSPKGYWSDTLYDLVFDTIGGLVAYLSVRHRL